VSFFLLLASLSFHNSIWLVANDIIIGIAIGAILMEHSAYVATVCEQLIQVNFSFDFCSQSFFLPILPIVFKSYFFFLQDYTITSVQSLVRWLMGWPAGLKLNANLSRFMGELSLCMLDIWRGSFHSLVVAVYFEAALLTSLLVILRCIDAGLLLELFPLLPQIIYIVGASGFLGASMIFALFSDLISFFTMHLHLLYSMCSSVYRLQVVALDSLFQLFRGESFLMTKFSGLALRTFLLPPRIDHGQAGKKRNVLQNRLDSCDYDLDQLMLGTILFTVLLFLLPTVGVYHVLYSLVLILACLPASLYISFLLPISAAIVDYVFFFSVV
jgi:phosphatidylinositol glycan class Q protein